MSDDLKRNNLMRIVYVGITTVTALWLASAQYAAEARGSENVCSGPATEFVVPTSDDPEINLARELFNLRSSTGINNPGLVTESYLAEPYNAGEKYGLTTHAGIDFRARPAGKYPVYSVSSGIIESATLVKSENRSTIAIWDESCECTVLYLHLDSHDDLKKTVHKGQLLGCAGSVGASAPHLHFEIRKGRHDRALSGRQAECGNDGVCSRIETEKHTLDPLAYAQLLSGRKESTIAIALIIDKSASMIGYITGTQGQISKNPRDRKKLENAKQAAKAFIAAVHDKNEVSVSSFSENARTQVAMTGLAESRAEINQKIDSIVAESSTNIPAGLEKAFHQLEKAKNTANKMAILLSDGENTADSWEPIVKRFRDAEWPVCTIGFGTDADEHELRKIAKYTGCIYDDADTINIVNKYQELSAHATNSSVVLSATDILGPRSTVSYPFEISAGTESFAVMSSWQGSKLGLKLVGPESESISSAQPVSASTEYSEGATFQVLRVLSAEPGQWRVDVDWEQPPETPEQVHVSIAEKSDVYVRMHGFQSAYEPGDAVTISVQVAEVVGAKKVPLQDASIQVDLLKPDAAITRLVKSQNRDWTMYAGVVERNTSTLLLRDDGRHDDYGAGDGIFSAVFRDTKANGTYIVKASVRGRIKSGGNVEKLVRGYFQVGDIRRNAVTSSEKLSMLKEAEHQNGTIDNNTPYSEDVLSDPANSIEELQSNEPADEIERLMQQ